MATCVKAKWLMISMMRSMAAAHAPATAKNMELLSGIPARLLGTMALIDLPRKTSPRVYEVSIASDWAMSWAKLRLRQTLAYLRTATIKLPKQIVPNENVHARRKAEATTLGSLVTKYQDAMVPAHVTCTTFFITCSSPKRWQSQRKYSHERHQRCTGLSLHLDTPEER
jgi:hypothetical protein